MATDLIVTDPLEPSAEAIDRAAALIRRGGIVAIPTDTLYTLVCDPLSLKAVGRIFAAKGLIDSNKLRALAIASATRSDVMPQVPTFAEGGWPQIDATSHRGIIAPAGTPREVITRMNAAINKVLTLPAVRARMTEVGYVVTGGTPEDFGRLIRAEMEKWAKILRDANIRIE